MLLHLGGWYSVSIAWYSLNLGKVPLFVTQGTNTASLQPALNAIKMEDVSTITKSYTEAILIIGGRICLQTKAYFNFIRRLGHDRKRKPTWYSMEGSFKELRQMAQISAQISQDHIVTAFHFLISKRTAGPEPELAVAAVSPSTASTLASSAMLFRQYCVKSNTKCLCEQEERFRPNKGTKSKKLQLLDPIILLVAMMIRICLNFLSFCWLLNISLSVDQRNVSSKLMHYKEFPIHGQFQEDFIAHDARDSHRSLKAKPQDPVLAELALAKSASGPIATKPLIQRCKDGGEAYSAAYLISKEHLIYQKTNYNLTWVNCEMGSFIMMNGRANPQKNINGSLLMSVDVLDFSVIHLSAYERLLLRWTKSSEVVKKDRNNLQPVIDSAEILRQRAVLLHSNNAPPEHPALHRTVIVMPFLGSDMGAGHSKLANRQAYLAACFWSFYAYYPYVVAMVKSPKDRDYVLQVSGLPFWDVILLEGLPKSASLPVATVQITKAMILNGTWGQFDYVFFTESDQVSLIPIFLFLSPFSFQYSTDLNDENN